MKFSIKFIHYILAFAISTTIFFLYIIQNSIIKALGIIPWLLIEVIWFFVLRVNAKTDEKALNLLFSSLFLFTAAIPVLEVVFFGSNYFSINKQIVTLFTGETAFFILYILFLIFFLLYFIVSLIFYLNLNHYKIESERKGENLTIKVNKDEKLKETKEEKTEELLKLNLPEIQIKPFLQDDFSIEEKENKNYANTKEGDIETIEDNLNDNDIETEDNLKKVEDEIILIEDDLNENEIEAYEDDLNENDVEEVEEDDVRLVEDNLKDNDIEEAENSKERIEDDQKNYDYRLLNRVNQIIPQTEENEKDLKSTIDQLLPESIHPHFENLNQDDKLIEEKASIILKTLRDFGIDSKLLNFTRGPVVTRFELEIDEKVNLSKIINLEKNITYNLSAERIRILAPIPGKKAVGIEIPNDIKQIVYFSDLIKQDEFIESDMHLPFILGKDIEGKVIVTDISKSPHLLIAGRTGSGKSVCINTLITSLVIANPPEKVRLILIDPKRVELSLYNDLPHLLTDEIIIYPEDASAALKWLVCEMENRYSILKEGGFRSIEDYNLQKEEKLPYLVLIIDEFYALMQIAQKIIEDSLIHLSAMARAVGIHLIFATQRPSAEVVTGVIKSNLPSRIAFQTFSKTDSRIILDTSGAESLLGNGDMLFSFAGLPPVRIQGAFISTNEVRSLVGKIAEKYQAERKSINDLFAEIKKDDTSYETDFEGDDPLYSSAIEIVKKERKISASYLQRRLKIGYNRAARMVEQMEEEGLVSPLIDGKKREIYI